MVYQALLFVTGTRRAIHSSRRNTKVSCSPCSAQFFLLLPSIAAWCRVDLCVIFSNESPNRRFCKWRTSPPTSIQIDRGSVRHFKNGGSAHDQFVCWPPNPYGLIRHLRNCLCLGVLMCDSTAVYTWVCWCVTPPLSMPGCADVCIYAWVCWCVYLCLGVLMCDSTAVYAWVCWCVTPPPFGANTQLALAI